MTFTSSAITLIALACALAVSAAPASAAPEAKKMMLCAQKAQVASPGADAASRARREALVKACALQ